MTRSIILFVCLINHNTVLLSPYLKGDYKDEVIVRQEQNKNQLQLMDSAYLLLNINYLSFFVIYLLFIRNILIYLHHKFISAYKK